MILAIDYGRAKIGVAFAEGTLAAPLRVLYVKSWKDALEKISALAKLENAEKVIVGVSEGKMGNTQKRFAQDLERIVKIPVDTWDETLSTHDAQSLLISASVGLKARRKKEDAFAAAVVLQSYLDNSKNGQTG